MRTNLVKTIYLKEMREVLRDKRMLFLVILMPFFLYPVLFFIIGKAGAGQQEKMVTEKVTVLLNPEAGDTPVYQLLKEDTSLALNVLLLDFDKAMIDTMKNAIGIVVDDSFTQAMEEKGTAPVTIIANMSDDLIESRSKRISGKLQELNQQILVGRLQEARLEPGFAQPIAIKQEDTSSVGQKVGKAVGGFLPMILLLFIFTGSIYIAIDITAGEKERRTLQTLFTAPVKVREIIAGKFLAVSTVGVVSAAMNITSLVLAIVMQVKLMGASSFGSFSFDIPALGWVLCLLIILFSTVFIAALSLGVVLLANSYKEAQSYVSPLMILILIPSFVAQMPGMELTATTALIPVANIALALASIFKGALDLGLLALVAFFAVLYAAIALFIASLTFGNENVVTGEKVELKAIFSGRR
jgi:sodium transport system permease protein